MRLWPGAVRGAVAVGGGGGRRAEVEQKVSRKWQRGCLSCVAFVTDTDSVQAHLPQILIGNDRLLPKEAARDFMQGRTDRIFLLRRKSAWITADVLCHIVRLLAACLKGIAHGRFFVLSLDACPVHLTPAVMKAVAASGLHFHVIPASCTRWLQPLDVAVFGALKHRIRSRYLEVQLRRGRAELEVREVLAVLAQAINEILNGRSWTRAFSLCGLCEGPPTSRRFLAALGSPPLEPPPPTLPNLEQLQVVFPARRQIPIDLLFQSLLRYTPVGGRERSSGAGARGPAGGEAAGPGGVWRGRTRSTSHAVLPGPAPPPPRAPRSQGAAAPRAPCRCAVVAMDAEAPSAAPAQTLKETSAAVFQHLPADPLKEQIDALRVKQARVRQEKKELSKAVRNATKKQQRLRKRSRLMSSEDLVAVLLMRKEAAERDEARGGSASTTPTGSVSQSSGDPPAGAAAAAAVGEPGASRSDGDAQMGITADERRDD